MQRKLVASSQTTEYDNLFRNIQNRLTYDGKAFANCECSQEKHFKSKVLALMAWGMSLASSFVSSFAVDGFILGGQGAPPVQTMVAKQGHATSAARRPPIDCVMPNLVAAPSMPDK